MKLLLVDNGIFKTIKKGAIHTLITLRHLQQLQERFMNHSKKNGFGVS